MKRRSHRLVPGLLAAVMAASCADASRVAAPNRRPTATDRILPSVAVSFEGASGAPGLDSVSVRAPLRIRVRAQDNASLAAVVTRVLADTATVGRDSTVTPAGPSWNAVVSIPWVGVRAGQLITVRTTVRDGANNVATAEVRAVAFDPNVPRMSFVLPLANAFAADSYFFDLAAADTAGIVKLGYRAIAPGFSRADSIVAGVPRAGADTASFGFAVPLLPPGSSITITPFAENRGGLRSEGAPYVVRISAPGGVDAIAPLVFQWVPPRAEAGDSIRIVARDPDGQIRSYGFLVVDAAGSLLHRAAESLTVPTQQVRRRQAFALPASLRGRPVLVVAFATDGAGHTGYATFPGATVPTTDVARARRDPAVYAFGSTYALPPGVVPADIAVDTTRTTVYVSNVASNQVEAFAYAGRVQRLAPVTVGSQPWGLTIDNSNSLLFVANSGEANVSWVSLDRRVETSRTLIAPDVLYDVTYSKAASGSGYQFTVGPPVAFSGRPQNIAQSASGALYYSSRAVSPATPGTLRRLDNFLDPRAEPRQVWQYGASAPGHYLIANADRVDVVEGTNGAPDQIRVCDHAPGGDPATATCVSATTVEDAVTALTAAPVSGNVAAARDLSLPSLALSDTNLVAVGGDRRRIVFGEGASGGRAGRVLTFFDPTGTPANGAQYNAPIKLASLTFNASDRVFGIAVNTASTRIAIHGVGTFFADSALQYVGGYPTFAAGAGVAFHPGSDDASTTSPSRVAFVASGDRSIQIVDAWSMRQRGRIPLRESLQGPLRAVFPSPADLATDPTLVVKLFGFSRDGLVVIDLRRADLDTVLTP